MSDIRSFFQSKGAKTTPVTHKSSVDKSSKINAPKQKTKSTEKKVQSDSSKGSSEDVIHKKKKIKRITIESDSDEEPLPQPLRKSKKVSDESSSERKDKKKEKEEERVHIKSNGISKSEESVKKKSKPPNKIEKPKPILKPVNVDEFFGATPPAPTKSKITSSITLKKPAEISEKKSLSDKDRTKSPSDKDKRKHSSDNDNSHSSKEKSKSIPNKKPDEINEKKSLSDKDKTKSSSDKEKRKSSSDNVKSPSSKEKSKSSPDKKRKIEEDTPIKEHSNKKRKVEEDTPIKEHSNKKAKLETESKSSPKKAKLNTESKSSSEKSTSSLASKLSSKMKSHKDEQISIEENGSDVKKKSKKEKSSKGADKEKSDIKESPAPKKEDAQSTPQSAENKKKNYWAYKQREGPTALGSKELPKAAENCLQGFTFVITGVLECFEREEFVDHIQRYGGKVTGSVSGKTSYLIIGRDPGQSKLDKAAKHNTKKIDEDGFIELLKSKPPKGESSSPSKTKSVKADADIHSKNKKDEVDKKRSKDNASPLKSSSISKVHQSPVQKSKSSIQNTPISQKQSTPSSKSYTSPSSKKITPSSQRTASPMPSNQSSQGSPSKSSKSSLLWVDKYAPKTMKQLVGQQGDKSNANKLMKWLRNWKKNNDADKPKGNYFAGKEDGSIFKAALLSGPPGVGKTTTASLVCKEVGFEFTEMNASDTRGKKALDTIIKESLSNTTVTGMLQGSREDAENHVLIMDEVDGMAGNEDRGGMQELIQLIKKSKIPIICMCNDRNSQKIRSLANYCFDLRFYRPRVEQIKGFALSISAKEGLKIPPQAMEQIVVGTNQDIRQVLHNLQMWTSTSKSLSYDDAKENAKNASKNIKLGPFDIVKQLFTHSEASKMSIHQKTDLFFTDYSFIPLFVQENYLNTSPAGGKGNIHKILELVSQTADSIADGNLVESKIRSKQSWSLLPLQGIFSTVIPSMKMSGYMSQRIDFPQWLGKNSSRGKHDRILQELKMHMALSSNCMKTDVNLDYLPVLKKRLTEPLTKANDDVNGAVKEVVSIMDAYDITRQDWDSIVEVSCFGKETDVMTKIPTKVKSAFTRLYNKESHKTPYALQQSAKKGRAAAPSTEDVLNEEDAQENDNDEEEEDEDLTKDAMIKMSKPKTKNKSDTSSKEKKKTKAASSSSKSKSKTQGKEKAKR